MTRIDGALPHHLAHHCIVVEEHLHLIVEAVPDVVYALAYYSAQLGLDAFGRPKLMLAYTYQCLLREVCKVRIIALRMVSVLFYLNVRAHRDQKPQGADHVGEPRDRRQCHCEIHLVVGKTRVQVRHDPG